MSVPFEELSYEPNRTPAERLGAIVGRRFVFSREQWPAWCRLVDKYGWPLLIKAADRCDPTQRFTNHVEAMCAQLKKSESEQFQPVEPKPVTSAEERKAKAAQFLAIRLKHGLTTNPEGAS